MSDKEDCDLNADIAMIHEKLSARENRNQKTLTISTTESPHANERSIETSKTWADKISNKSRVITAAEQRAINSSEQKKKFDSTNSNYSPRSSTCIILRRAARAAAINRELNSPSTVCSYASSKDQQEKLEQSLHLPDNANSTSPLPKHIQYPIVTEVSKSVSQVKDLHSPSIINPFCSNTNLYSPTNHHQKNEGRAFNDTKIPAAYHFTCPPSLNPVNNNYNESNAVNSLWLENTARFPPDSVRNGVESIVRDSDDSSEGKEKTAPVPIDEPGSMKQQQKEAVDEFQFEQLQNMECNFPDESSVVVFDGIKMQNEIRNKELSSTSMLAELSRTTEVTPLKPQIETQQPGKFECKNSSTTRLVKELKQQLTLEKSASEASNFILPDRAQIERLNNRKGRPAGIECYRRHSGQLFPPNLPYVGPHYFSKKAPQHFLYMHSYSCSKRSRRVRQRCLENKFNKLASAPRTINRSQLSSNFRPSIRRLETIYSQESVLGPIAQCVSNSVVVAKQPLEKFVHVPNNTKKVEKKRWKARVRWGSRVKHICARIAGSTKRPQTSIIHDKEQDTTSCVVM
ncbi:hypothetical protein K3495_g4737 [Podosphaera aphanis]|nr:hypothetical protein K3495_g4737 [Podosphaera aphanis]